VEFNSPLFCFSREAVEEVLFVVSLLTRTYRFSITQRFDFHAHVGNADEGFDPDTIQNLMATYWTFEDQIEQIHPPWMINSAIASNLNIESGIAARAAEVDPLDKQTSHLRRRGLDWILKNENCNIKTLCKAGQPTFESDNPENPGG
jgi:hypothetical protein